jgi:hypothetical protein
VTVNDQGFGVWMGEFLLVPSQCMPCSSEITWPQHESAPDIVVDIDYVIYTVKIYRHYPVILVINTMIDAFIVTFPSSSCFSKALSGNPTHQWFGKGRSQG